MKQFYYLITAALLVLLFSESANAQAWKNSETHQSVNREADFKKRKLNNENFLKNAKDAEMRKIHQERVVLLSGGLKDIATWKNKIDAGEKKNAFRYNLLLSIILRKSEAMQMLVTIRTQEIAYELFGADFKQEALSVLKQLRKETYESLASYDKAIKRLRNNIK